METLLERETVPAVSGGTHWSPAARIAFRFCFLYFGLYCLLTQIIGSVIVIPLIDLPDPGVLPPVRQAIFWVASHVFRLRTPLVFQGSGSGDKAYDWVQLFCILIVALVGTAIWSVLDRKRQNYRDLRKWFWLALRFCLAGQMFVYGLIKAFPMQMAYPNLNWLVQRFGDFSPAGILWATTGASPAYESFCGCAELAGGLLLIFRRTRTLGALICMADMSFVFLLNMTYDVPVKLLSVHLALIAAVLLVPEAKRILNFFFLNRIAEPATETPLFSGARARRIGTGVIAFLWLWILANDGWMIARQWHSRGSSAEHSPLYGIWDIQSYTLDGVPQRMAVTDAQAWRRMIFDYPHFSTIECMDDSHGYGTDIDSKAATLVLTDFRHKDWQARFHYARSAFDKLQLDGTIAGNKASLTLTRLDEKKLQLESRGFHWVQDYPFIK